MSEVFDVTVLYFSSSEFPSDERIDDHQSGNLREIIIHYPKRDNLWRKKRALDKAFETGIKMINRPDLIHGHCILPKGHLFVKAKAHFNCPLIITEHGSYFRKEKRSQWTFKERMIASITKKSIDKLIAVSDFQRKDLLENFKNFSIDIIPNSIHTQRFRPVGIPAEQPKEFLHISTLDAELKNPKGIIEAADLLSAKGYTNFHLTIISDESYASLQDEVARLKLDRYISFEGPIAHDELVSFYNRSHALVMFSRYETFSIVMAEAWACGIPVISTPVGIAADMDSHLGLTVQGNDALSLALEMEKMINGKEFHRQVIREHALQYDNVLVLERLVGVYEQLLGHK